MHAHEDISGENEKKWVEGYSVLQAYHNQAAQVCVKAERSVVGLEEVQVPDAV